MPSAIRSTVQSLAYKTGIIAALSRRLDVRRIVMFHGVGGPHCAAGQFQEAIRYLRASFEIVPLSNLATPSHGLYADRRLALTFDDGLRNNVTVAYPILKAERAPATFF